ncbi:MAG: acyl-CoA dehydrogenase family protein [Acidimicrobiales bacterium]
MDLALDVDQESARELLRRGLGDLARPGGAGRPAAAHRRLEELGVWGMAVPEDLGGGGAAMGVLVVAAEEAGRAVLGEPLVEHLVTTRALARHDPAHPELAACAAGATVATFAPRPAGGGIAALVPGGARAGVVVALDDAALVAVTAPPPAAAPASHADLPLADRRLGDGRRRVLADGAPAEAAHAAAVAEWRALTAAALVGVADRALEVTVAYVKERHQFGVPIGSFQALQHGLAELPGSIDGARLLAHEAAWAIDGGSRSVTGADGAALAAMALLFAADVARSATAVGVQYHGGYGYAEEHEAQRLYRHARGTALGGGGLDAVLDELAAAVVAGEAG